MTDCSPSDFFIYHLNNKFVNEKAGELGGELGFDFLARRIQHITALHEEILLPKFNVTGKECWQVQSGITVRHFLNLTLAFSTFLYLLAKRATLLHFPEFP